MKIRIAIDFEVHLKTDGEELDADMIRVHAQECLRTHIENVMGNEIELEGLMDALTEVTEGFAVGLDYRVD